MNKSTSTTPTGLSAAPESEVWTERTVACNDPNCVESEHKLGEGEDYTICTAGRASHGSVDLEVFRAPEDGLWKMEIYADFISRTDGVTLTQAIDLAADIVRFARLVDKLNFGVIVSRNLGEILSDNDDPTPVPSFGDMNDPANFITAGRHIERYGRGPADLLSGVAALNKR